MSLMLMVFKEKRPKPGSLLLQWFPNSLHLFFFSKISVRLPEVKTPFHLMGSEDEADGGACTPI